MQINRPLIWILASYLAGILLKGINLYIGVAILGVILFLILLQLIYVHKSNSKMSSYYFLTLLPFAFILGYYLTNMQLKPSSMDTMFEEDMEITLLGEVIAIEENSEYQRLTLQKARMITENVSELTNAYISNKILVYNSNILKFRLGNILKVSGTLKKFQTASNPGQFNEYQYYKNKKFDYKMNAKIISVEDDNYNIFYDKLYNLKLKFRQVYNSILTEKESGIISAMILGDTNALDEDVSLLYKQNGISHMIAISGLHVSLLGLTLFKLMRRLGIHILPSTFASIFLLYSYGILTGFGVSTNRSIVMLILYMISLLAGRTYDLMSSTALSALLILIQNPMELFSAGFLLSFGAIAAIGTIFQVLKKMISTENSMIESLLMCMSIQFVTTPILLYYFYEIPTYSVFINLIIIPLSSLVILLAVIAVILGLIYLPLGIFFIGGVHFLLIVFEEVCKLALHLPFRRILTGRPDSVVLITYFLILIVFLLLNQEKVRRLSLIILALSFVIFIKPMSQEVEITFLDVGQGDGVVINLPYNTTFLIDGGSSNISKIGKYRIETYLKYKGISDIDYAIVTHADKDHISGLQELMENMEEGPNKEKLYEDKLQLKDMKGKGTLKEDADIAGEKPENYAERDQIVIKHLVLPDTSLKDEAYYSLVTLAEQKGIPVLYIKKGDMFRFGDITITCLHPSEEFMPKSRNAYSTVLSFTYKKFDLLLTGDLEEDGEELVNAELKKASFITNGYEVLKVAHHGSKYSSNMEFLTMVSPEYAIISCGKNNSYGHPHEELLSRLEEVTKNIKVTSQSGAITIRTDGERMGVWEYLQE